VNPVASPIQVVVAYDFSPSAEEALQRAIDVACRAPQHVLHVVAAIDPHQGLAIEPTHHVDYPYAQRIQELVTQRLTTGFTGCKAASEVQFYIHARIGKPADQILALAEDVGADLIFIGSHGKTGVERLVLGSVSERVVREARCPVMIAREKTYPKAELARVIKYEHDRPAYTPPHRFSYVDQRVIMRPNDWPLY
jgi:nucleotide-binding universal stress UspA family protein